MSVHIKLERGLYTNIYYFFGQNAYYYYYYYSLRFIEERDNEDKQDPKSI